MRRTRIWLLFGSLMLTSAAVVEAQMPPAAEQPAPQIDFDRARALLRKQQRGEQLSAEDAAYLQRARAARQAAAPAASQLPTNAKARATTGLKPLTELSADERYKGQDGGLYGGGRNTPSDSHLRAAEQELARIQPLDAEGQPSPDGRIVFVSISMSNATQEFSRFKQLADADAAKSNRLTIVDCAQGGQAMAEWARPAARPWAVAEQRIASAGVSLQQVQVAWIKLANKQPRGDLEEHGRKLQRDTLAVIHNAKTRFPNLRIIYLSSRIYGGYATGNLNPEPYAYESAYVARWLIEDQTNGDAALNYNPERGEAKAPLLLWGPYLWADGTTPRQSDGLHYTRDDLAGDGTHPSPAGRAKVARVMLDFYKTNPLTQSWFTGTSR